jgi:hypothetical protein
MLDTIVLTIPERDVRLRAPERFAPHAAMLRNPALSGGAMVKAIYNPSKTDKATGYKPRLTLLRRPYSPPPGPQDALWQQLRGSARAR